MSRDHEALRQFDADYERPRAEQRPTPRPAPSPTQGPEAGADVTLCTLSRGDKGDLVLRLRTYEGRPYADIRLFEHGRPTGKGTSIRIHEIDALCEALTRAKALVPKPPPKPAPIECPDCHGPVETFEKVRKDGGKHVGVRCPSTDCERDWIQWVTQGGGAS